MCTGACGVAARPGRNRTEAGGVLHNRTPPPPHPPSHARIVVIMSDRAEGSVLLLYVSISSHRGDGSRSICWGPLLSCALIGGALDRPTVTFPLAPEADHCRMLRKVRCFPYEMPLDLTPPLVILITELLCKTPARRLRTLERFRRQTFFHGTTFDLVLLQRQPVDVILELRERPDRSAKARRGLTLSLQPLRGFDYDSLLSPTETPDAHLDDLTQTRPASALPGPGQHLDDLTQRDPASALPGPGQHLDDLTQTHPCLHPTWPTNPAPG
ncbi:unnamed protein product [Merluccius merluccius]